MCLYFSTGRRFTNLDPRQTDSSCHRSLSTWFLHCLDHKRGRALLYPCRHRHTEQPHTGSCGWGQPGCRGPNVPRSQLVTPPASVLAWPPLSLRPVRQGSEGSAQASAGRRGKINFEIPEGLTKLLQRKLQQVCRLVRQDLLTYSLRCHMEHYK